MASGRLRRGFPLGKIGLVELEGSVMGNVTRSSPDLRAPIWLSGPNFGHGAASARSSPSAATSTRGPCGAHPPLAQRVKVFGRELDPRLEQRLPRRAEDRLPQFRSHFYINQS